MDTFCRKDFSVALPPLQIAIVGLGNVGTGVAKILVLASVKFTDFLFG